MAADSHRTSALRARWTGVRVVARAALGRRSVATATGLDYGMVFVVGCPRSGTTWIHSMLDRHPLVVSSRESHAYVRTGPVRARGPRSVRGWAAVFRKLGPNDSGGLQWYADRRQLERLAAVAAREETGDQAADRFIELVFDNFALASGATEQHVFVEKTPNHLWHAERILRQFPRARMVEVVRDGRDVCVSMQVRAPHVDWIDTAREDQINKWVRYVEEGERLRGDPSLRGRILKVRYEDVHNDPVSSLASLFNFAALPWSEADLERIVAATRFDQRAGAADGSTPNRRGVVGDWRTHFSDDDVALFRRLAGHTAAAAGYTV